MFNRVLLLSMTDVVTSDTPTIFDLLGVNPRWSSLALLWMLNPFLQLVSEQEPGSISSNQQKTRKGTHVIDKEKYDANLRGKK